jgi:hypothetical protein
VQYAWADKMLGAINMIVTLYSLVLSSSSSCWLRACSIGSRNAIVWLGLQVSCMLCHNSTCVCDEGRIAAI